MRFLTILVAASLLSVGLSAQQSLIGTPIQSNGEYPVLDENLERYEIFQIEVVKENIDPGTSTFMLNLELGDKVYELNLYKDNLTTEYYNPNKPLLMGGSLNVGGDVSLTINDDFLFGFFRWGQTKMYIEPVNLMQRGAESGLYVLYNIEDVIETGEHVCGAHLVESKTPKELPENILKMPTTACKVVDYAIANTFNMIAAHGSITNVMNFNLGVLNDVQTNYRSEFDNNLEYIVVAHYVAATAAQNPYWPDPLTGSTNAGTLLGDFRDWAQGPGNAGGGNSGGATGGFGIDYNMAGCWTDTDISGGVVGVAYSPGWHHLLEDYNNATAASFQVMVSHEIGHNWDAVSSSGTGHDPSGSDFIMAPSVTITDNWSTASKGDINARVNGLGFLAACSTQGVPDADFFQTSVGTCTNEQIDFEDQSQYGATRVWDFPSGSPTTSTDEKESVTYSTNGLYGVSITSTNGAGSDSELKYVDIQSAPPNPCTTSGSNGSQGITRVRMVNLDNSSGTAATYQDFACSVPAVDIEENTSYDLLISVSGVTRLRYYIDYNNDGDFDDANEDSGQFIISSGNLTYLFTETTPTGIPVEELLRFRIITSTSTISNSCHSPSTGQIEDYSLYIDQAQVYGCTDPAANNYDPLATVDDGSCTYGSMTWYEDSDGDTYGNPLVSQVSGPQPPGFVLDNTDCDDTDANVNPGATEVCDGVDNDCDGLTDEGVVQTFYEDFDGDGFGNPNVTANGCTAPPGFVSDNTDCDDNDVLEFPGQQWFKDFDGDEHGDGTNLIQCERPANYYVAAELISVDLDCDDNDANAFPGNTEVCDGVDNDCDGDVDEGVTQTYYFDNDSDGYGDPNMPLNACSQPTDYVSNNQDCDDNDALEFPGQEWYKDLDGDQYGDGTTLIQCLRPADYYVAAELIQVDTDCDDNDALEFPGQTWYKDLDGDDYGDGTTLVQCSRPVNYYVAAELTQVDTDCNDNDALEFPGQTWYKDADGDNFGDGTTLIQCTRPTDYYVASELTEVDTDCDDTNDTINPDAVEQCGDLVDNDCDGDVDEGCSLDPCDGTSLVIPTIAQNTYRAEIDISSTALANNGQSILFTAGTEIALEADFEVASGTEFTATILPCDPSFNDPENDEVSKISQIGELLEIASDYEEYKENDKLIIRVFNKYGTEILISRPDGTQLIDRLKNIRSLLKDTKYLIAVEHGEDQNIYSLQK